MISVIGKFIFVLALCIQGSLLIQGVDAQKNYNQQITALSNSHPSLTILQQYPQYYDFLRIGVAGLYILSVFILLSPTPIIPFLTSIGVIAHSFIVFFPDLAADPTDMRATIGLLKNLSIIGGLVYLIGSSCSKPAPKKDKDE